MPDTLKSSSEEPSPRSHQRPNYSSKQYTNFLQLPVKRSNRTDNGEYSKWQQVNKHAYIRRRLQRSEDRKPSLIPLPLLL